MESLKNLKPTGLGLKIERIKPPLVVEKPVNCQMTRQITMLSYIK